MNYSSPKHETEDPLQEVIKRVQEFGYPIEVFTDLETEDKYLLTLFRIPHGLNNINAQQEEKRPVVLIVHGCMASSIHYVLLGPKRGLAFLLADGGYDVWLGNYRGSKYARKHKELDPNVHQSYWDFSFHEIGLYDLPAMINVITDTTKCEQISYIGTSQGSTSMFVLLSQKPQYNNLLKVFICLAPVHCPVNMNSMLLRCLVKGTTVWERFAKMVSCWSYPTESTIKFVRYMVNNYCQRGNFLEPIPIRILFWIYGDNHEQLDKDNLCLIINSLTNATSMKHLVHFCQSIKAGHFQQFDYGVQENLQKYEKNTPPVYDLSQVTCPVALFHSRGDLISRQADLDRLKQELPNVVKDYLVENNKFNHMDFTFAVDVVNLLYVHVIETLNKYNNINK